MKNFLLILSGIVNIAWIPFFFYDWKIAGLVFLVMFGNNLMLKGQSYEN